MPTLFLVTVITFLLAALVPGDPARIIAGEFATDEAVEQVRETLGLNDPWIERFGDYLGSILHGDLGTSVSVQTGRPVADLVMSAVGVTASVTVLALLLGLIGGLPIGFAAALRPNGVVDRVVNGLAALAMAVPQFVTALVLVLFFSINLGWLPAIGYSPPSRGLWEWLSHLILAALSLALIPMAEIARQTRGALIDALEKDYVRMATSSGLRRRRVIVKYALKNAAIPIATVFGLQVARVFGGSAVIEFIFALPGLGSLTIRSVLVRDVPVIQAVALVGAAAVVIVHLVLDISYRYFDPRLRSASSVGGAR